LCIRHQFDTGAVQAGNDHLVGLWQGQINNALAHQAHIRQHHPFNAQFGALGREGNVHCLTNDQLCTAQGIFSTDQMQQIPRLQSGLRVGHRQHVATLQARANHFAIGQHWHLGKGQTHQIGVAQSHV
jgi:hypothetical protein